MLLGSFLAGYISLSLRNGFSYMKLKRLVRRLREFELARADRKLARLEAGIDEGRLGPLVTFQLNWVCRRITRLEALLGVTGRLRSEADRRRRLDDGDEIIL
jgi:hypothetical protein